MRTPLTRFATAALGAVMTLAAFHAQAEEMAHGSANLAVKSGWVRAVPPTSKMSAAYMVVENRGAMEDALVSASTDAAAKVELHNVRSHEGMMMMFPVENVPVPAHGSVELKPGSYHVMLIGLNRPMAEGAEVALTLNFKRAGEVAVTLPVQSGQAMGGMGGGDQGYMQH